METAVRFQLGKVYLTPGALELSEALLLQGLWLPAYLARHAAGDWGDLCEEDREENELSLREGFRIFSSYETPCDKLWIITEADRSSTTILLPEEY